MKTKKAVLFIFIALFFTSMTSCGKDSITAGTEIDEYSGATLQNIYDSLASTSPLLKDFRENYQLNPRINLADIPGSGDEGQTIITCDGVEIFNQTWNIPSYMHDRMKTQVRHGYSENGLDYFLWVYNISTYGPGVGSDYEFFIIRNNGQIINITDQFRFYIYGIQEYKDTYIIKSTNGWVRSPAPGCYSLMDTQGNIKNYEIPWEQFH